MTDQELLARISMNPAVMFGKPVIKGTRLTVEFVLNLLAHGVSIADITAEYFGLTEDDVRAYLLFATKALGDTSFMPLVVESVRNLSIGLRHSTSDIRVQPPDCGNEGRVDPGGSGQRWRDGGLPDEAFGMSGAGGREHLLASAVLMGRLAGVDGLRGEEADAGVAMLGVVPGEEAATERTSILQTAEASGEVRSILEGLELGFGEGVVVGGMGAAVTLRDPQVNEQPGDGFGGHGGAAISVQRELAGGDLLFGRGLGDEAFGQGRLLVFGEQPAGDVAAGDVQEDVEIVVRQVTGPRSLVMSQLQTWLGPSASSSGLW